MAAGFHVALPVPRAAVFSGAPLRYVVLLKGPLRPVRHAAPADFSQADVLSIVAGFYCGHAFSVIVFLSVADVALQGAGYGKQKRSRYKGVCRELQKVRLCLPGSMNTMITRAVNAQEATLNIFCSNLLLVCVLIDGVLLFHRKQNE